MSKSWERLPHGAKVRHEEGTCTVQVRNATVGRVGKKEVKRLVLDKTGIPVETTA